MPYRNYSENLFIFYQVTYDVGENLYTFVIVTISSTKF